MPYIGCHVSINGGVEHAPKRAADLGCNTFQIFTANQMQWKASSITEDSQRVFLSEITKYDFQNIISHDSYLVNLGSPDPKKLSMSRNEFIEEIRRSTFLKIPYIVFHPGSHMGKGDEVALKTIAESLDYCMEAVPDSSTMLLLENTAGQGTNVGYTFEHLRTIIDQSQYSNRLGVCLDTCHAFTSGYDLITEAVYNDTFKEFEDIIGLDRLKVFHLNDSKKTLGSRVDRHDQLGKGFIGLKSFYRLVNDERFAELPMILETPGDDEHYTNEIKLLKNAIKP